MQNVALNSLERRKNKEWPAALSEAAGREENERLCLKILKTLFEFVDPKVKTISAQNERFWSFHQDACLSMAPYDYSQ